MQHWFRRSGHAAKDPLIICKTLLNEVK
jgi:hypothetical protein